MTEGPTMNQHSRTPFTYLSGGHTSNTLLDCNFNALLYALLDGHFRAILECHVYALSDSHFITLLAGRSIALKVCHIHALLDCQFNALLHSCLCPVKMVICARVDVFA